MNRLSKSLIALGLLCVMLLGGIKSAAGGVNKPTAVSGAKVALAAPYTLPPLPYAYNALEPHIDANTMQIHHDVHHKAYVDKLNAAIAKHPELKGQSLEVMLADLSKVPEDIRKAVQNHGGGHYNHSMFWSIMGPKQGGQPTGKLAADINQKFGSFAKFQEAFENAGTSRFGSGWVWLVKTKTGGLEIISTGNQDTPLASGAYPILGNDVWEHAYYLKYQSRRSAYLKAWWNVVNWSAVSKRYTSAPA